MILLIDNYDSFVYNLARYFNRLGLQTHVVRNDAVSPAEVRSLAPQAIVLSPGPGKPEDAGVSTRIVSEFFDSIPLLGICLGHQAIVAALGGRVVRASRPMHGRTSLVTHDNTPLFAGVPQPFTACRYHSLIAEVATMPERLIATAKTERGTIMAIEHDTHPVYGLQFHPEAILTECGYQVLSNFLTLSEIEHSPEIEQLQSSERLPEATASSPVLSQPVTF